MIENILLGVITAFIVTFYSIPKIINVANHKKLYDLPNSRKVHTTPIPSLGGVGIFAGFMISILLFSSLNFKFDGVVFQYYLLAFIVVFFFGLKDDIVGLSPHKKLFGQILVSAILLFKGDILITNMHGFLGIYSMQAPFTYVLTAFTIIVIMNSFNLIDGIDGLAATIGIVTSSVFAWFFYLNNDMFYSFMGFSFAGSLLAFSIFNYPPAKIFMGDTGSMLSGAVNAIMVIHFMETANSSKVLNLTAAPALGFGILILPLLDTLRVFSLRMMKGKSPFYPDRTHLHHILLDRGWGHGTITISLGISAILLIILTYIAMPMGTTFLILTQVATFFVGILLLQLTKPGTFKNENKYDDQDGGILLSRKIRNVVTLIDSRKEKTVQQQ